jgi:exodeoxyribonuclease VII small subunit
MATKKTSVAEVEPKGYVQAMREIDAIILEIDSNNVDIDVLAEKIKRASFLVAWCNERINATEVVVDEIVADIDLAEFDDNEDEHDEEDDDDGFEDNDE